MDLNVDKLSTSEQKQIWQVLQRDKALQNKQYSKINELRTEIQDIRMKGILRDGDDSSRLCARCHSQLGVIFNKGEICPNCRFKMCKNCRVALLSGGWTCIYCFKQMQLKWLSGDWTHGKVQPRERTRRASGSDLLRSAIVKAVDPGNAGKAVTEEIRRAITNGSVPPPDDQERDSSLDNSPLGGSTQFDPDAERAGFPSESDSFRLSRLIGRPGNEEKERVCVKRATSRPYRDSDSDSSSSLAASPTLSATKKSGNIPQSSRSVQDKTPEGGMEFEQKVINGHKKQLSPMSNYTQESQPNNNITGSISNSNELEQGKPKLSSPGVSPQAESKPRLIDLARSRPTSPQNMSLSIDGNQSALTTQNISASINSAKSPTSYKSDAGSEHELFRSSPSKPRNIPSSDGSDNEQPIDSYFTTDFDAKSDTSPRKKTGKRQKHGSNEDTRSEASNPSYVYDQHSESSSVHSTPDHRSNENKRRLDADPSLPSITISEAEGLARTHGESDGENHDFLMKGSSQSIRSGQSMSSSLGLTSSMGSRDSLSSYYSNAGEVNYGKINVTGDIQFGLDYDYKTSCLEIRVKQCHNLAPADTKKNRSDPYIKSYLLPDKTKTGKRKTKVKKNSLNPTFDETLRYNIAKSELENRTLWLTVWHNDRFGRNDFLGEVNIPFDYYRFEGPALKWYPLQQRQEYLPSSLSYKGELTLSLKFVTSEKLMTGSTTSLKHSRDGRSDVMDGGQLHVCVKEAKNLTAVRSGGYSDPFCKGYLLPEKNRTSKQKTPVVKKNCNPVWNHSFIFEDVSASMLADRCLELTLWDHDRISSNDFLGGVRLNLGSGICGRRYVDWMDAVGDEISLWQSMISRPNTWVDGTLILRANMNNRM